MGIYIMQSRTIMACWEESSPYEFNYVVHMDDYIHLPRRQKKMAESFDTAIKIDGVFTPRTIPHRTPMGTSFKAKDAVLRV